MSEKGYGSSSVKESISEIGSEKSESFFCDEDFDFARRIKKDKTEIREGVFYCGEWLDDCMDGYGVLQDQNFSVYEGFFRKDLAHGYGSIIF